jgi:KDO2-lipid IV(A) lauroyltransferase
MPKRVTGAPFSVTRFLAPRYWLTWIGLGITWALAQLPYRWLMRLGRGLGRMMGALPGGRRHVATVNLSLCFPELSGAQREEVLRKHFESLGMALMETALCWWAPPARLHSLLVQVQGLEHLEKALGQGGEGGNGGGKGAMLLIAHFTTMEMAGTLLSTQVAMHVTYRQHKNALFDEVMRRARLSHHDAVLIEHDNIRAMLRTLKHNNALWYAPDQNYAGKHSTFAPFFGIPAATMTGTAEMARISGAPVIPLFPERLPDGRGYRLTLQPALEGFPTDDATQDAARINALFESHVRRIPEQYLWVHRRFKTRPAGEGSVYRK